MQKTYKCIYKKLTSASVEKQIAKLKSSIKNTSDPKEAESLNITLNTKLSAKKNADKIIQNLNTQLKDVTEKRKLYKAQADKLKGKSNKYNELLNIVNKKEIVSMDLLYQQALGKLIYLKTIFPNFYLELQYHGLEQERIVMPQIVKMAKETNTPLIAANDAHITYGTDECIKARQIVRYNYFQKHQDISGSDRELYLKEDEELIEELSKVVNSRYRNVTVTYKDVKDEEAYQENIPDYKFTETTNSAELLSMAMVYFDFDLEEAGKTAVTDYIRKLYNGSHTTSVATQTYTYWIDEDTVETYTDANVTLTTYYFNDLFSCKLKDNFGTLSGSNTAEQVWNYFISAGFTPEAAAGVMGNLYQESHLDPTAIQNGGAGPAAGICQMETYQNYNSRWGQMAKLAESRGKDWTDLSSQLDFMLSDMPSQFDAYTGKSPHYYPNGEWCWWPEKMTLESYKALTDVNKATEIFERVFERGSITRMSERFESANLYYDMYKNMTPGTDVQQKIVNAAYSQLGVNYVWGGTTPNVGLDCSGLTQYCYSQAGISIPRTSQEQSEKGKVVTNPEPGDICVSNNAGHVAIYIGNGQMIEAPDVGQQVKVSAVRAEKFVRFY